MIETVRAQLMSALKETARGRWANTRAITLALERRGHRLSEDSVKRYLGMLANEQVVERDFVERKSVWRLK